MNDCKSICLNTLDSKQNLRELVYLTFLNLMSVQGVAAKTIIRNHNNKQQKGNDYEQKRKQVIR